MNLLIITQRVDDRDANLAFHVRWIAELAKKADHVTVIAQTVGEYRLPSNVSVHSLGKEMGANKVRQAWRLISKLASLTHRHDAVLVLMIPAYVICAAPFALISRKPIFLWYAHGHVSLGLKTAVLVCKNIFSSSERGFRVQTPKARILGQAIDTAHFSPNPNRIRSTTKLVTVGRISPVKHVNLLIEAVRILRERGIQATLDVIGEPILPDDHKHLKELKCLATAKGLADAIIFRGALRPTELPDEYQTSAACVNASTTGSLDKAVLEAMACECPVVTGNEAYHSVLPAHLFVSTQNAIAFADALEHVIKQPPTMSSLRELVVREHDLQTTINKMYQEMQHAVTQPSV